MCIGYMFGHLRVIFSNGLGWMCFKPTQVAMFGQKEHMERGKKERTAKPISYIFCP